MSSRDDLKKMLKQYSIPLKGLKNKQDYVQALLDSGWVQDFDQQMATAADDDADVLPSDDGAIETGTEDDAEDMEVGVEEAKDGKEPTSE